MNKAILSPITKSKNVRVIETVLSLNIINAYRKVLGINVSANFEGVNSITKYQCLDTTYQFFEPYSVMGDGGFYAKLQEFEWYYSKWKWEHEIALSIIKKDDKVLEIGSGLGYFLKALIKKTDNAVGIEMNSEAAQFSINKWGVRVFCEDLEKHSIDKKKSYDVVCSFQVFEHIYDINKMILESLALLKDGGKLIISVPNNSSHFKYLNDFGKDMILNLPPHHIGYWDKKVFENLPKFFPMKLEYIKILDSRSSKKLFVEAWTQRLKKYYIPKVLSFPFLSLFILLCSKYVDGLTIQACFKKE